MLLERCRNAEDQQRDRCRDIGLGNLERADAVDPHHGRRGVADDAAGAAGVGRRDDRGEIADMDLALNTCRAIVPPISAAAMLSRKLDRTNTITSSAKPPFQSSGRNAGISSGIRLFSKWRDSSAKPISNRNRFARITHSCCMCRAKPAKPRPNLNPVNASL